MTPANRFALFNDEEEGEVAAPVQQYHGRASEPAIRWVAEGLEKRMGDKMKL